MNKPFKKMILAGWLLIAAAGAASAQDSLSMNLERVLEVALSDNPTVKVAGREINRITYAKKEYIASLFPTVSANAGYTRALKKQVMAMEMGGQTTEIAVGTDNQWSGGFQFSMPLVAPTLWKTIQMSQTDVQLAVEASRESKISLVNQVKKAYYSFLLAQDSYRVIRESYENALLNARNVEDKYKQGLASEYDKLRADVQAGNIKPQLVSTSNAVYLAGMQLKVLMGVDVDEPIRFEGDLAEFESSMNTVLDAPSTDLWEKDNTSIRQLDLQMKKLGQAEKINRMGYVPTLSLSGTYQWISLNNDFRIGHYLWYPYSTIGLSLNIPIFDGTSKNKKTRQNKIQMGNLEIQREDLVRNLELSINNSLKNMETAVEELGSNKESILAAEKAYTISQKRYDIGSGTLLELNDAQVALIQASLAYNQSIYNYLSAQADLEMTLGKGGNI